MGIVHQLCYYIPLWVSLFLETTGLVEMRSEAALDFSHLATFSSLAQRPEYARYMNVTCNGIYVIMMTRSVQGHMAQDNYAMGITAIDLYFRIFLVVIMEQVFLSSLTYCLIA